jgi:hypothetical protein
VAGAAARSRNYSIFKDPCWAVMTGSTHTHPSRTADFCLVSPAEKTASFRVGSGFVPGSFGLKVGSFSDVDPFGSSTSVASFAIFKVARVAASVFLWSGSRLRHSAQS